MAKRCDFCDAPLHDGDTWLFPSQEIESRRRDGTLDRVLSGDWLTCNACKPLVVARDLDALVQQYRRRLPPKTSRVDAAVTIRTIRELYTAFFAGWKGDVVAFKG